MCQTKNWKSLETITKSPIDLDILAIRSDNLMIKIPLTFMKQEAGYSIIAKISKAFKRLESYRNCKCSLGGELCDNHKRGER